jgi:tRNA(Arg) A34 adenosine deaminase TadA
VTDEAGSPPAGAWAALEEAFTGWKARGLPCGAALVDGSGTVVARGRNHAYDPVTGEDPLEGTPLAHAELNVLARVPTDRDLTGDTLWSTQQPCAMCTAALAFCEVGEVRYLASDPAFVATDDPRAGEVRDPTADAPELGPWAILANALFLQPAIWLGHTERLARNEEVEPEMVAAARLLAERTEDTLDGLVAAVDDELRALWTRRLTRLG